MVANLLYQRRRDKRLEPITIREQGRMLRQLRTSGYNHCAEFIKYINDNIDDVKEDPLFHANVKRFLRALTSNEPITQMLHPQITDTFIRNLYVSEHERRIQKYSPVLYLLLFADYGPNTTFPDSMSPLLKHMAAISNRIHNHYETKRNQHPNDQQPNAVQLQQQTNFMRSGSFYSTTKKRNRPLYSIDRNRRNEQDDPGENFSKTFAQFRNVTGGVWMTRCLIHAMCVGCHIIPISEGKNDPFSTIYCHWQKAPTVMCGDFNC